VIGLKRLTRSGKRLDSFSQSHCRKATPVNYRPTENQLQVMKHALGLTRGIKTPYRNHFCAGEGHADWEDIMELCRHGLMRKVEGPIVCLYNLSWLEWSSIFMVTTYGKLQCGV